MRANWNAQSKRRGPRVQFLVSRDKKVAMLHAMSEFLLWLHCSALASQQQIATTAGDRSSLFALFETILALFVLSSSRYWRLFDIC